MEFAEKQKKRSNFRLSTTNRNFLLLVDIGYGTAPMMSMQPPPGSSLPMQPGGAPAGAPPSGPPPSSFPGGGPPPNSSGLQPAPTQMYNVNPNGAPPAGTSTTAPGGYSYPQPSETSQ